jgi:phenylacetate-CoA ligase
MKKNIFKNVYAKLPDVVKQCVGYVPFSIRMGRNYRETLSFLRSSQYWPTEKIDQYQFEKLKETLAYAYLKVPYYKDSLKALLSNPDEFSIENFERLPILSKDEVFDNFERLKSIDCTSFNSYTGVTGGTTGKPLTILFEIKTPFIEWAFIHSLWSRINYSPSCKRLAVANIPLKDDQEVNYKIDPFHNELQLSILNLDKKMELLFKAINRFKPKFIYGYPSAISLLAARLEMDGLSLDGIQGILCGSENYSDNQVALIERVFNCTFYTWYGQTEKVVLAGWCEHAQEYHIMPEYSYAELIDENNNVIREPGVVGEIIGTSFINNAMPLIRYRTGDMGQYAAFDTCVCGRNQKRLKKIIGRRNNDYLVGMNNERIPLSLIDTQQKAFTNVYQMQFKQTEKGHTTLFLQNNRKISSNDVQSIKNSLNVQLIGKIMFDVILVEELEKTKLGKTKICVQSIK